MVETTTPHPRVSEALESAGVNHAVRRHSDCAEPVKSPKDFARCLGRPVGCITKSLFLEITNQGDRAGYALAVCPVTLRLDLDLLARHWNAERVGLAGRDALAVVLGYPPTGVSPLGCEGVRIAIDDAVFAHPTVLVGGGAVGVEVEIAPEDLRRTCGATRFAFTHS